MPEILDFVDKLLSLVPLAIKTGGDVVTMVNQGRAAVAAMRAENRGPTDAEWSNLNATIDGLMGQLKE